MADPVRDRPGPDYPGLIKPDRVHGSLYTGHLTQLLDPSADRWRDA